MTGEGVPSAPIPWPDVDRVAPSDPASAGGARRPRFGVAGTATVVRFNWPKYVGVLAILIAAVAASASDAPLVVVAGLAIVGVAGAAWSLTSLVATWWVYDHRRVYTHIAEDLGAIGDWASIHAGFDEATAILADSIGHDPTGVVELSMQAGASLRRARTRTNRVTAAVGAAPEAVAGATGAIPFDTASLDVFFASFAVHEIRDRIGQQELFAELARTVRPGGRLVVTEHLRDLPNAAVYGPGALHFQAEATWVARAGEAGFVADRTESITPYVKRMVWTR